jgi:hypothetical protein
MHTLAITDQTSSYKFSSMMGTQAQSTCYPTTHSKTPAVGDEKFDLNLY